MICTVLGVLPCEGRPQGAPLPIRYALGRAPTRGAPTDCLLSALFALGRAPTRGAPTDCLLSAFCPGKGAHKGCPYRLASLGFSRRLALGRAPTRGAPTDCLSRRSALGRAPTRGAPTDWLLSAFGPGKGAHKGCPYRLASLGVWPWEGHPQGVPLPIGFSRRSALGRAPTRGAPTDWLLSAFGPGKGTHKGCPYRLASLGGPWEGRPQGVPLPDWLLSARGGHPQGVQAASRGFSNLMQLPWHPNESALGLGGVSFWFLVTPLVRGGSLNLCFWVSKACQQLSGMGGCLDWCSPVAKCSNYWSQQRAICGIQGRAVIWVWGSCGGI